MVRQAHHERLNLMAVSHRRETMPSDLRFGVVSHSLECRVDYRLGHGFFLDRGPERHVDRCRLGREVRVR